MNRLFIVGNGFDLAHGLKTSYSDFMKDYWSRLRSENKSEVNNHFLKTLFNKHSEQNWVDVEMEYFNALKICFVNNLPHYHAQYHKNTLEKVRKLNTELLELTKEFDNYLDKNVIEQANSNHIFIPELYRYLGDSRLIIEESIKEEIAVSHQSSYNKELNQMTSRTDFSNIKTFDSTLVLNFNYTPTVNKYLNGFNKTIINIHGSCRDENNPINMGFGNESHEFYKELENMNEREFLRFMKSFQYTNNDGYRRLISFLETGMFQVQLMGHSCGLSDKTLLNAIFEHHNCASIKLFYHKFDQTNSYGENDNYTDIVTNMSRHFGQKTMMRDRIVNKEYCWEMPQIGIQKNV